MLATPHRHQDSRHGRRQTAIPLSRRVSMRKELSTAVLASLSRSTQSRTRPVQATEEVGVRPRAPASHRVGAATSGSFELGPWPLQGGWACPPQTFPICSFSSLTMSQSLGRKFAHELLMVWSNTYCLFPTAATRTVWSPVGFCP